MTLALYHNTSLSLLTDFYQITMAYAYWKRGMSEDEAVYHLFFRKRPFKGGFSLSAGLEGVIDYLQNYRFHASDIAYLADLKGEEREPLFEEAFLKYLASLRFSCHVDAILEGEVIFPFAPLIRVQGPIIQCQLLESVLLNLTNFATLIATKSARICLAAQGDPVIEFGLRRAQGIDGAMTASRSAYIGGCTSTSNVLAGKMLGIPVKGTHAHSWVMAFETEGESFQAYAEAMPKNCIFLVDTYDTLQGVRNAIEVGKWLRTQGRELLGIRLDSGDLAYLSSVSRKMLDEAGFHQTKIMASNELDETLIADLKQQGAQIAVWGVGTSLVTGHSQSALDGVYKLSAVRKKGGTWRYTLKLSEQMTKISHPGILQVRRYSEPNGEYVGDAIYDVSKGIDEECLIIDPFDHTRRKRFNGSYASRDLLVPIFNNGELVYKLPKLEDIQRKAKGELTKFDKSIKRFYNPHLYPVGMEESLYHLKISLVEQVRMQTKREQK